MQLSCKLTSFELQKRKETIISKLINLVLEKKELANGFSYKFKYDHELIDLLSYFIKTEKECCDFFSFTLRVKNNNNVWLNITGPQGVKDFIKTELEL